MMWVFHTFDEWDGFGGNSGDHMMFLRLLC